MAPLTPANRFFLAVQAGALLVLILFISELLLNRQNDLNDGVQRTRRFNHMMAEHTARTFDAVDILLREISSELARSNPEWQNWNENEGWNYLAKRHSASMPQLRSLLIYDTRGMQRFQSTAPTEKRNDVSSQKHFSEMLQGRKVSRNGPYLEESTGQYTYALSHRISNAQGHFTGLLQATLDPVYLQDFCWPNRLAEEFEAVLINTEGKIVAACRPSDQGRQSPLIGRSAEEALFKGALRGLLPKPGNTELTNDFVISLTTVSGFPELQMLTAAPVDSLLVDWRLHLQELSILAALVIGIILTGGLLIRQQLIKVSNMTAALKASHAEIEQRVEAATQELAKQLENAELTNIAKSRFLAAASHDLRQPMHALSLFTTDLQAQSRSGNYRELPRLAEQISSSTRLLSELLDSLLDISRMDVSGITPGIRSFPLQTVFERLHATHRRAASDKKQILRFRSTALWLYSDPDLLERMLGNLIANALRYTPAGGRILILARKRGDQVVIEVRDNGIGIAQENQLAIFTEFYQVANQAREQHHGLGLGLSIVDRLAKALSIKIGLRSALNQGTVFSLTVQGSAALPSSALPEESGTELRPLYLIGNSQAIRAAGGLAESWGYQVKRLEEGAAPPAVSHSGNPLILTEARLVRQVREEWPGNLTLIALASHTESHGESRDLPEGTLLCPLPLRPAKLRALLGQIQNTSSKSIP